MSALDAVTDPAEAQRVYYRHLTTGDRGYEVQRDGKLAIKWDRPFDKSFTHQVGDWKRETDEVPTFSAHQIAMVAFKADKELCRVLGNLGVANREWPDLNEAQRRMWMTKGPKDSTGPRRTMFEAITAALKGS